MLRSVVVLGALALPLAGFAQSPCGCPDVDDLINRINMAQAAIDKYQSEIDNAGNPGGMGNKLIDQAASVGGSNQDVLQNSVDEAMGGAMRGGRHGGKGKTRGITCEPDISADTACLKAVLDVHEAVHEQACRQDKAKRSLGSNDDRYKGMKMTAYAQEEIQGYRAEVADALKRLRALPKSCRPSDWIGTVSVLEIKNLDITTVTPPYTNKEYTTPTTRTSTLYRSRYGTIFLDGAQQTSYWHIEHKATLHESSAIMVSCDGGGRPHPPDRTERADQHDETEGKGFAELPPEIDLELTADSMYFTLSVKVPEVSGQFKGTAVGTRRGGCKPYDNTVTLPSSPWDYGESQWFHLKGRADRDPLALDGSDTQDFNAFAIPLPGATKNEHKIRFTWHLRRLD